VSQRPQHKGSFEAFVQQAGSGPTGWLDSDRNQPTCSLNSFEIDFNAPPRGPCPHEGVSRWWCFSLLESVLRLFQLTKQDKPIFTPLRGTIFAPDPSEKEEDAWFL
jgi:hypothetical protein